MGERTKESLNCSQGEIIKSHCIGCNRETNHEVVANYRVDGSEDIMNNRYEIHWYDNHYIVKCRGCDTVSFKHTSWFSEDAGPWGDGLRHEYYPSPKSHELKKIEGVPAKIHNMYQEVVEAYNAGALTLTAGGIRAVLEGVCNERFEQSDRKFKNLVEKIDAMFKAGYISEQEIAVLNELRLLGNVSLHEISPASIEQVELGLEVIEAVLGSVYLMEFRKKRLEECRVSEQ